MLWMPCLVSGRANVLKWLSLPTAPSVPVQSDVQMATLAPYLDLSHVRTLTYVDLEDRPFNPTLYDGLQRRLPTSLTPHRLLLGGRTQLSLSSLHVTFSTAGDVKSRLWHLFEPETVVVHGMAGQNWDGHEDATKFPQPDWELWPRVTSITLIDAHVDERLHSLGGGAASGLVQYRQELSFEADDNEQINWVLGDVWGAS